MAERLEDRLLEHLGSRISDLDEGQLRVQPWKNILIVENPETFHLIGQASDVRTVNKRGGQFYYMLKIPNQDSATPDKWTVQLTRPGTEEFREKYANNYEIRGL